MKRIAPQGKAGQELVQPETLEVSELGKIADSLNKWTDKQMNNNHKKRRHRKHGLTELYG